jgi:hypothetical protein
MYNGSVAKDGNHAHRLLQEEMRLRLANEVLGRVVREDGTVDLLDLEHAAFSDLLGELWMCYGWKERRKLARARDFDLAFLRVALDVDTLTTPAGDADGRLLRVDAAACRRMLDRLADCDELRAATSRWRRDEVRKHRSRPVPRGARVGKP